MLQSQTQKNCFKNNFKKFFDQKTNQSDVFFTQNFVVFTKNFNFFVNYLLNLFENLVINVIFYFKFFRIVFIRVLQSKIGFIHALNDAFESSFKTTLMKLVFRRVHCQYSSKSLVDCGKNIKF